MRLFTKADDKKLFEQYAKGSDMNSQKVVVKIFNPYGNGRWYIMNSDPQDPDYLWGIVDLGYGAEVGSISRSELVNYKNRFGLGFEKDFGFSPTNALEVYQGLRTGEFYAEGGFLNSDVDNWGDVENFAFQMLRQAHNRGLITNKQYMSEDAWQIALEHAEDIYDDDLEEIGTSDMGHYVREIAEEINEGNFANGGETKRKIHVVNDGEVFDEKKYKAIFDDFDMDGTANIDDANPLNSKKKGNVEQVELKETFKKLLSLKNDLDDTMYDAIDVLDEKAPEGADIYARTKTPYSILKKLVDKRLLDPQKGLTDLIGTTIAVDTQQELEDVRDKIDNGMLGKVLDKDDYYASPKAGYRAVHYIVEYKGLPVEVQLKTKNQKKLNEVSHEFYKKGMLNAKGLDEASKLVEMADRGDKKAITEVNKLFKDKQLLASKISTSYEMGGSSDSEFEAIFNSKKIKIMASSLWQAKTKAIQELKVPKSKVGLLAVYNVKDPLALTYKNGGKASKGEVYLVEINYAFAQKDGGERRKDMKEVLATSSQNAEQIAKDNWQRAWGDTDMYFVSAKALKVLHEWVGVFKKGNTQRLAITYAESKQRAIREIEMQRGYLKLDKSWDLMSVEKVDKVEPKKQNTAKKSTNDNRGKALVLAKKIRKEGETWVSAMKRAYEQLKKDSN